MGIADDADDAISKMESDNNAKLGRSFKNQPLTPIHATPVPQLAFVSKSSDSDEETDTPRTSVGRSGLVSPLSIGEDSTCDSDTNMFSSRESNASSFVDTDLPSPTKP